VRITFQDAALAEFGYAGHDQRVKILVPQPGRTLTDLPTGQDWYPRWRALPDHVRPTMRTYTVRAYRAAECQLDVDFVLHGTDGDQSGPLSTWAASAHAGDQVALLGPDRPGIGRLWGAEWSPPRSTTKVLLAGDETALPAISAIVQTIPLPMTGIVLVEVPQADDVLPFALPPGLDVRWLVRKRPGVRNPRGALLEEGVGHALDELRGPPRLEDDWTDPEDGGAQVLWDVPENDAGECEDLYVWMAGEAAVMKRLRRLARREHGLPKSAVACMGYWREGHCEAL
jgi:NADPH-dependent ferric siderophore reductase